MTDMACKISGRDTLKSCHCDTTFEGSTQYQRFLDISAASAPQYKALKSKAPHLVTCWLIDNGCGGHHAVRSISDWRGGFISARMQSKQLFSFLFRAPNGLEVR